MRFNVSVMRKVLYQVTVSVSYKNSNVAAAEMDARVHLDDQTKSYFLLGQTHNEILL